MDYVKKHRNQIYIAVTVIALVVAVVLCLDYSIRRKAEKEEAAQTVTTIKEKEKKDRAVITVNTKTIQDGLANMGVLITQEYYFTQVETYSKDKKIMFVFPSSSGFTYSYDGAVMAGVDFAGIQIETNNETKTITVKMPASEIQAVTIDKDTFKVYSEKDSLWNPTRRRTRCGTRSSWRITTSRWSSSRTRPRKRHWPAAFSLARTSRPAALCASLSGACPAPLRTRLRFNDGEVVF